MIYTENEIKEVASISKSSPVAKIAVAEVITIDTDEVKEEESVPEIEQDIIRDEKKWKWIATVSLFVFAIAILSFFILRYVGYAPLASLIQSAKSNIDKSFYLFMLAGFLAQMVDGAVGMGYGVTSTSLLMSMGVPPAAISGSVHTAEIFSSAASGYSHYKFGNVIKNFSKCWLYPGCWELLRVQVCWCGWGINMGI